MNSNKNMLCIVCLGVQESSMDCVQLECFIKPKFEALDDTEEMTYLDCFELVTNLKVDPQLYLCLNCCDELKLSFSFLRKAEKAQRLLSEMVDAEENEDFLLSNIIEEIVEDENVTIPVLTDAMLGSNSNDNFELESLIKHTDLECERDENSLNSNDNFSSLSANDEHIALDFSNSTDITLATQNGCTLLPEEPKNYACHLCSKVYNNEALLKVHLRYHKRKNAASETEACEFCQKRFSTRHYLRQHIDLVHTKKRKQFKCDQCEKIYFTESSLRTHKRVHNGTTVNCTECDKSFVTQYDLKIHMRFHSKTYPYECTFCDRKFCIRGHLTSHLLFKHQGLKLQCEDCGKLFTSTKALNDHSFVHTGMPFPCSFCEKSYPSKQKYKVHLKSVHNIEFDEISDQVDKKVIKQFPRRKNLTLVQVDSVIKEVEISNKGEDETESVNEYFLEVS